VAHVSFEIVDSAGIVVPTAGHMVSFTITGGSILALDNANLRVTDSLPRGRLPAFNGRGLAYLRATAPGMLQLDARADGLAPASVTVTVIEGRRTPAVAAVR
jgi:beta-galactosidase